MFLNAGNVMKKKTWIKRIKEACEEAGTYKPYFDNTINSLAGILEKRDEVEEYYEESGEGPIVKYTNKAGAENMNANPALTLWDKLNATALTYWRELGLTPSGYKKITGEKPKEEQKLSGLAAALASIES